MPLKPRQICVPARVKKIFFAVIPAKRFQTRTEEEIQQLLRDKNSKSTDKATHNAAKTLSDFYKEQNLNESFQDLNKTGDTRI